MSNRSRRAGVGITAGSACLVAVLAAAPVGAQRSFEVVDALGQAVPAVRLDVWGRGELIETVTSSAAGVARVTTDRWSEVRRLSLEHVGYQTLVVQADELPPDGVLRMEPLAIRVEGLRIEGRGALCPVEDDPPARNLWRTAAARYARDTGQRGTVVTFLASSVRAPRSDIFRVDASRARAMTYGDGPGIADRRHVRHPLDDFVATHGYAWPPRLVTTGSRQLHHAYLALDGRHAHHFASPLFGRLHDFAIIAEREGSTTLAFCPSGELDGPTIRGLLTITPDDGLVAAEWRFRTDDPDEDAGGEVVFTTFSEGASRPPHLVAERSFFFRHDAHEQLYPELPRRYYREARLDMLWTVCPTALITGPARASAGGPDEARCR